MGLLEDHSYIYQPFTSAGRVPLESGYRYFVEDHLDSKTPTHKDDLLPQLLDKASYDSWEDLLHELSLKMSHLLQSNVVIATVDQQIHTAGLHYLLQNPEFQETSNILPLIRMLENTQELFAFLQQLDFQVKKRVVLLIGKEHIWGGFSPYSTVASYFAHPSQKGWIMIFGPTRMHYSKNIASVQKIAEELSQLETL